MRRLRTWLLLLASWLLASASFGVLADRNNDAERPAVDAAVQPRPALPSATLRIGSKRFTESYVLGEILAQTAARSGTAVRHLQGLGNTAILLTALRQGEIDLYVEYSGTIAREILGVADDPGELSALNARLAPLGLAASIPLGFDNRYALAVGARQPASLQTIGDLAQATTLRVGVSHEFLGRADGWPGLARHYGLAQRPVGLDHGLAFEALAVGQIDVTDVYSTDARIISDGLRLLADDRGFFPSYRALVLHRIDTPQRFAAAWAELLTLQQRISDDSMVRMNAAAEVARVPIAQIARRFLASGGVADAVDPSSSSRSQGDGTTTSRPPTEAAPITARTGWTFGSWQTLLSQLGQHLWLVAVSTLAASVAGIALGSIAVQAAAPRWLKRAIPSAVGLLQTIPSLALLALLIPLTGRIGAWPAMIALFIYALLPIVSHTITGLSAITDGQRAAGDALGLRRTQRFVSIELAQATPALLAGVRTAAVIGVGTATVAAFIGAGGLGQSITQGLALNDRGLLLAGALPAAALAWIIDGGFALAQRRWALRHGQLESKTESASKIR